MTDAAGRRVAFLAPLPPQASGIADYSAALLPHLAQRLDLEAFTRDPQRSSAAMRCGLPLRRFAAFHPTADRVAIYQLGNHAAHHGEIYRLALRHPGIAVLHEHVLHDLVRDCTLEDGGPRAYAEELRYCLGRSGARLAARLRAGGERLSPFDWPLFERIVDSSLAVIVHSRAARDRIARSRPLARVRVVPHLVEPPRDCAARAAELRRELEIPQGALVFGAFGIAAAAKRIDTVLDAFARLERSRDDCAFLLVGPESPRFVRELGDQAAALTPRLRVLDRVPLDRLETAMAATDVALNLRFPTGGETSATCLRLLALARPVVVTDLGWFSEIPDDACVKVRPDALEEPMLDELLLAIAARPELRRALGENGRRWAIGEHSIAAAVDGYSAAAVEAAAARGEHRRAPPPASRENDVDGELLVEVAAALGDLGVTEVDEDVLGHVACLAAELGIGSGRAGS
ncbi:MAG TPA: glycosyltransferase family 4 protein [Thermoanaerobaculia bacterium]|nr:glycosyltransferase family 4 protein [Thermoanaerobaculia bacterium]